MVSGLRFRSFRPIQSQAVRTWYGILVTEELEVWGADIEEHTGNQRLSAFAPEYLLTRIQVVNTIVEDIGTIRAAHSFNAFRSDRSGLEHAQRTRLRILPRHALRSLLESLTPRQTGQRKTS